MEKVYISRYGGAPQPSGTAWWKYPLALLLLVALAVGLLVAAVLISPPVGMPILEYHRVNTFKTDDYTLTPEAFAEQMDYLKSQGYTAVSFLDFLRAKKGKQELPDKPAIITFDDGYKDNYTDALPILEARQMKATVFMVTNSIGLPGYLTFDDMRDMQQRGIEIGSHTANHLPLTDMSTAEATDEIKKSKLWLEWNHLNTVFVLSYPNGEYRDDLIGVLKANNYLAAVTGNPGLNTFDTDPYMLKRIYVPRPRFGLAEFKLRLLKAAILAKFAPQFP